MQHRVSGIVLGYCTYKVPGLELLPLLNDNRREIAVDGNVASMSHKHILGTGEVEYSRHYTVIDATGTGTSLSYIIDFLIISTNVLC